MSTYRAPHRFNRREREEAERKAAAEAIQKKMTMNETNFPVLVTAQPIAEKEDVSGTQFARLATEWAQDVEADRTMKETKKQRKERERKESEVRMFRYTPQKESRVEHVEEEVVATPQTYTAALDDGGGWTKVERKTRKVKRELTIEEIEQKFRDDDGSEGDGEFNGHLLDSKRHDHDRV
jgi:nitrogen fixation protein FixH